MPTIPDVNQIQTRAYSGQQQVAPNVNVRRYEEGEENVFGAAADSINEVYAKQIKKEVGDAKVKFQLIKAAENNAYDQDQEFDTIEERWSGKMMDGIGQSAESITDPTIRDAFIQESMVDMENSRAAISDRVHLMKSDKETSVASNSTDALMKAAIKPDGDILGAFDAIKTKWESLSENGYTTHENAQAQIRGAKLVMAKGRIKAMTPEDQLEALDSPWAQELPQDTLNTLRLAAKDDLRLGQAQTLAYSALEEELTLDAFNRKLYKEHKGNPKLMRDARDEFLKLERDKEYSNTQASVDFYEDFDVDLRDSKISIATIKKDHWDQWESLSPAMRSSLEALETEKNSGQPPQYTNQEVRDDLFMLWGEGPSQRVRAKQYYMENRHLLNDTDRKIWAKKVFDNESKSLLDINKIFESMTVGMSRAKKADVYNGISRWYLDYQEDPQWGGAEPPPDLITQQVTNAVKGWSSSWYTMDESPHSMSAEKRVEIYLNADPVERSSFIENFERAERDRIQVEVMKKEDFEAFNDINDLWIQSGDRMNISQFVKDYEELRKFRKKKREQAEPLIYDLLVPDDSNETEVKRTKIEEAQWMKDIENAANR